MAHQIDIRNGAADGFYPMYSFQFSSDAGYAAAMNDASKFPTMTTLMFHYQASSTNTPKQEPRAGCQVMPNHPTSSYISSGTYVEGWADMTIYTWMWLELNTPADYNLYWNGYPCTFQPMIQTIVQTYDMTSNYSRAVQLPYGE